jgi:hypothetical protein
VRRQLVDIVRQLGGKPLEQFIAGYARLPRQRIERVGAGGFLQAGRGDRLVRAGADPGSAGIA